MKPRNPQHRSLNVSSSRWTAYALAGLATASGGAISAEGAIHYSGPVQLHMNGHESQSTWRLPLTDGASLLLLRSQNFAVPGEADGIGVVIDNRQASIRAAHPNDIYAANLPIGANISSGMFISNFPWLIGAYGGRFIRPGIGCVGIKFDTGKGVQYGWARIRTNKGGRRNVLTLMDYAWADPGEPISAGQTSSNVAVPDKGSLGLLALGATGLAAWRKSRRRVNSAAV